MDATSFIEQSESKICILNSAILAGVSIENPDIKTLFCIVDSDYM